MHAINKDKNSNCNNKKQQKKLFTIYLYFHIWLQNSTNYKREIDSNFALFLYITWCPLQIQAFHKYYPKNLIRQSVLSI